IQVAEQIEVLTGNAAAAYAVKLAKAQVIATYPITPQTTLVERIADFITKGELKAEYIKVESEHSALAACIGASLGGARAFTATSAQGLLLMQEMLFWAAYGRTPMVMAVVTRAIAPPWNMWSEHTDALSQRDSGWIQIFCHNNQEVLDTVIQAYKISEDKRVMLPVMVCFDGFEISHTSENVKVPEQRDVDDFLPSYDNDLIDPEKPKLLWNGVYPDDAFKFKMLFSEAAQKSKDVIDEVHKEFDLRFGRRYSAIEVYGNPDSEIILIAMGSVASSAKAAVDVLNKEGLPIGLIRIRLFRPFPTNELQKAVERAEAIVVLDRSLSFTRGILSTEVAAALYNAKRRPTLFEYITGLGGAVVSHRSIVEAVKHLLPKIREQPKGVLWMKAGG
ncbi:MAG: transketolase C-terminal domain-containing protein, partial [Nitrososphaerales archaeon]